jgi:hypothetical protein
MSKKKAEDILNRENIIGRYVGTKQRKRNSKFVKYYYFVGEKLIFGKK